MTSAHNVQAISCVQGSFVSSHCDDAFRTVTAVHWGRGERRSEGCCKHDQFYLQDRHRLAVSRAVDLLQDFARAFAQRLSAQLQLF